MVLLICNTCFLQKSGNFADIMGEIFHFKQFSVCQDRCAMKVGTDGVLLGALAGYGPMSIVLDIGTGTGLIALMLAQRFPDARITGIDIVPDAASQAADNFAASPWADRLEAVCADIREIETDTKELKNSRIEELNFNFLIFQLFNRIRRVTEPKAGWHKENARAKRPPFDHIVCNPPFYEHSPAALSAERNQARRTDTLAYEELAKCASRLLREGGVLEVIIPYSAVDDFIHTCWLHDLHLVRRIDIRTKVTKPFKRAVVSFGKYDSPIVRESGSPGVLTLLNEDSVPSDEYRTLTGDFYIEKETNH